MREFGYRQFRRPEILSIGHIVNTNLTPRLRATRKSNRVDFQIASESDTPDYVTRRSSTFAITIKSDVKGEPDLYNQPKQPFDYDSVDSLPNALRYFGATLSDDAYKFIAEATKGDESGKATKKLVDIVNSKLKADAKSNEYQKLVNEYKPLEGEKKETAMTRLVLSFVKLAKVSKESAIETLRASGALPEDFTIADLVPLRKAKGEVSDE
jgi:hypothetical protein